ncbi:hypothetical protein IW18_00600 [Flavobacterium hibernum]|uniref:Uncharacterized protein n=1 Tax=Flavobacterium hibernum TaxID=37752 RepID=A0A0D0F4J6_9FLAO|nr:hypothetical protein IW18_00600 [Flavobacterium hibernum]OXA84614.1 hypothetical protein B0A73_18500 [Flavobacterium hibernum]
MFVFFVNIKKCINLCDFCFNDLFCVLLLRARITNPRYLGSFTNSCKNFTKFDPDKINFAIVKTKGKFDLKPKLKFDY